MDSPKTRSQKKREAKMVEDLARELVNLPGSVLSKLPCAEQIVAEIQTAQNIKQFGARRRQIKYLSKLLREIEVTPLLDFLEEVQKSRLKQNKTFQRLEQLRNRILCEDEDALLEAKKQLPDLDLEMLQALAHKYRLTCNQRFSRQIFRQLKIAQSHAPGRAAKK